MSKQKTLEQTQRQELARMYFMQGMKQKEIADKVGVSRNTICAWIRDGKWDKKMLQDLDEKLTSGKWTADDIVKVAAAIEKLDKQTNIVTIIEVFTSFNQWLVSRMQVDSELTPEVVKIINTYQDKFISEKLSNVTIPIE